MRLVADLADGSRLIGTPDGDDLQVTTAYAEVRLAYSDMHTVDFDATPEHAVKVAMHNGDILNGRLPATGIVLNTCFGRVTIPINQVKFINVRPPTGDWPDGLVLHFDFGEGNGEKVIDSSGSGNDGTIRGANYVAGGKLDGALSFNGKDQDIVVKNVASLQLQDFSIVLWIKRGNPDRASTNPAGAVLAGYGNAGYGFGMLNNGALFLCKTQESSATSELKVVDQEYHQIAVTKKGASVIFYVDGVAGRAQNFDREFEFKTDFGVGGIEDPMGHYTFDGLVHDAAVFKRALSGDEIKDLFEVRK